LTAGDAAVVPVTTAAGTGAPLATVRAVGFDLDGTLIDSLPDLAAAINAMLLKLGYAVLTQAKIRTLVGDGAEPLVERALDAGRAPGARAGALGDALAMFKDIYSAHLFRDSRLYPGVVPTLEALRDAGLALFCVTNKDAALAGALMREAGLEPYMAFTIGTRTKQERKPSPDMLLRAAAQLGLAPGQMLYVGDSVIDMQASRAAGCAAVAVGYGYDERIRGGAGSPDALIANFADLSGLQGLTAAPER
jgi:phosphoglycolate phosphatase